MPPLWAGPNWEDGPQFGPQFDPNFKDVKNIQTDPKLFTAEYHSMCNF